MTRRPARAPKPCDKRLLSIWVAHSWRRFGKVVYVHRPQDAAAAGLAAASVAQHCDVTLIAAGPHCLDGWTGAAILAHDLPATLRVILSPRVAALNRASEARAYLAACTGKPVAAIARGAQ